MKRILAISLICCLLSGANLAAASEDLSITPEQRSQAFVAALDPASETDWEAFVTGNFSAEMI
ncbi:MAG: hypothetical protein O6931_06885, partial [Gammaproteobacteria bacterium]|nr:hypothetical protein [Gammaproteobacteria bacterium]